MKPALELLIGERTNHLELSMLLAMFNWQGFAPKIRSSTLDCLKHSKGTGSPCLFRSGEFVAWGFFDIVKWFSEESGIKRI